MASPRPLRRNSAFTPGNSEVNALGSRLYLADAQGNSRGLLDGSQNNTDGYNWDAFGNSASRRGTNPTAFAWNEESGYQSDGDSGLKLLGHRYYDSRTGRFISQDPAGDGDNWYTHADNDPMDEVDPDGLVSQSTNGGSASIGGPAYGAAQLAGFDAGFTFTVTEYTHNWTEIHDGSFAWVHEPGSDTYSHESYTFGSGGSSMFAVAPSLPEAALDFVAKGLDQAARYVESVATQKKVHECFTRGTRVQTKDRLQEIQTVHTGDLIWTRNLQTDKTEYRRVIQTSHHLAHDTVTIRFADAKTGKVIDTLTATPEHPFYVLGHGMTALNELTIGTLVVTRIGSPVVVKSLVRHHSASGVIVYSIEVAGDHTYFIGNAGEWVHNASFHQFIKL